jgi:hypothetical protein
VDFHHGHYFSLSYYIFHEICVHTPQSWRSTGHRNAELDATETCPLREGFVDAAAHKLLKHALENPDNFPVNRRFLESFSLHSDRTHANRVTPDPRKQLSKHPKDEAECAAVEARESGVKLFERMGAHEPREHVIEFALSLNVLPLNKDNRIRLMTQLDKGTLGESAGSKAGGQNSRTRRRSWIDSLRAAVQIGDLDKLDRLVSQQLGSALVSDEGPGEPGLDRGREEF